MSKPNVGKTQPKKNPNKGFDALVAKKGQYKVVDLKERKMEDLKPKKSTESKKKK